jgi:hypothetical protein
MISEQMTTAGNSLGPGFFVSHAFVDELGEKGWINYEQTPLCVVSGRRLGGNRLFQRTARFLQDRDRVPNVDQHVAKVLQLRFVADWLAVPRNDNGVFCCRAQVGLRCGNHSIDASAC